jgi:hypothetical protein
MVGTLCVWLSITFSSEKIRQGARTAVTKPIGMKGISLNSSKKVIVAHSLKDSFLLFTSKSNFMKTLFFRRIAMKNGILTGMSTMHTT